VSLANAKRGGSDAAASAASMKKSQIRKPQFEIFAAKAPNLAVTRLPRRVK
jgi:hypothetical protein